jgi:hypothetical protein
MKKVIASIFAVLYLSTSMGATVHLHYCMGRLVAWGLLEHSSNNCTYCGMQEKTMPEGCFVGMKNCCHDENKQIRNVKDQKKGQELFEVLWVAPAVAHRPQPVWMNPMVASPLLSRPFSHGPLLMGPVAVFLRNCNFRI